MNKKNLTLLLSKAMKWDPSALKSLFDDTAQTVLYLSHKLLRAPHLAEAAAVETYTRAFGTLHTLPRPALFRVWLCQMALSACLERTVDTLATEVPWLGEPDSLADHRVEFLPPDLIASPNSCGTLLSVVDELPGDLKTVILLYDGRLFSQAETARIVGVTAQAVQSRLRRARGAIRARMTERCAGVTGVETTAAAPFLTSVLAEDADIVASPETTAALWRTLCGGLPLCPSETRDDAAAVSEPPRKTFTKVALSFALSALILGSGYLVSRSYTEQAPIDRAPSSQNWSFEPTEASPPAYESDTEQLPTAGTPLGEPETGGDVSKVPMPGNRLPDGLTPSPSADPSPDDTSPTPSGSDLAETDEDLSEGSDNPMQSASQSVFSTTVDKASPADLLGPDNAQWLTEYKQAGHSVPRAELEDFLRAQHFVRDVELLQDDRSYTQYYLERDNLRLCIIEKVDHATGEYGIAYWLESAAASLPQPWALMFAFAERS